MQFRLTPFIPVGGPSRQPLRWVSLPPHCPVGAPQPKGTELVFTLGMAGEGLVWVCVQLKGLAAWCGATAVTGALGGVLRLVSCVHCGFHVHMPEPQQGCFLATRAWRQAGTGAH